MPPSRRKRIISMKQTFLDFEQPIADLQAKIDELRYVHEDSAVDISDEIERLQKKSHQLTKEHYGKLTAWQVAQVARHPQRPYTLDIIAGVFTDFHELHGDRSYADDAAIVGGLARFNGAPCMVVGHQKGRDTKEKIFRNFGMPRPEGYRKALRLKTLGLVDKVVTEPHGGAHRDHAALMATLKKALTDALRHAQERPLDVLLDAREDKLLGYGKFKEITAG